MVMFSVKQMGDNPLSSRARYQCLRTEIKTLLYSVDYFDKYEHFFH